MSSRRLLTGRAARGRAKFRFENAVLPDAWTGIRISPPRVRAVGPAVAAAGGAGTRPVDPRAGWCLTDRHELDPHLEILEKENGLTIETVFSFLIRKKGYSTLEYSLKKKS